MKKSNILKIVCGIAGLSSVGSVMGQATPLAVTGYTADVIAESSPAAGSTVSSVDGTLGQNAVFYNSAYGLGNGGEITTGTITVSGGNEYTIESATGSNALTLTGPSSAGSLSGTLTLTTPTTVAQLYVLGLGSGGTVGLDYSLNYTTGAPDTGTINFGDWLTGGTGVVAGLGRVFADNNTYDGVNGNSFNLYEQAIVADSGRTVSSVTFTFATGYEGTVLAVSGTPVPEPSTLALAAMGGFGVLMMFRRRK